MLTCAWNFVPAFRTSRTNFERSFPDPKAYDDFSRQESVFPELKPTSVRPTKFRKISWRLHHRKPGTVVEKHYSRRTDAYSSGTSCWRRDKSSPIAPRVLSFIQILFYLCYFPSKTTHKIHSIATHKTKRKTKINATPLWITYPVPNGTSLKQGIRSPCSWFKVFCFRFYQSLILHKEL